QRPVPQVEFAQQLGTISRMALNDVSDGIANEAYELATSSQVDIHIYDETIPTHPLLHHFTREQIEKWKYFGGEDFDILGTFCQKECILFVMDVKSFNVKVIEIGKVTEVSKQHPTVRIFKEDEWKTLQVLDDTNLNEA